MFFQINNLTMAYVLTDEQLERICESSPNCGCKCYNCEAFAANWRYNNGYDNEDDSDEDW